MKMLQKLRRKCRSCCNATVKALTVTAPIMRQHDDDIFLSAARKARTLQNDGLENGTCGPRPQLSEVEASKSHNIQWQSEATA